MALPNDLATKSLWTVELGGVPGVWEALTGGETTQEVLKHRIPGTSETKNFDGPKTHAAVTLSRTYSPSRDATLHDYYKAWKAGALGPLSVVAYPINADGVPVGVSRVWRGCRISSFKFPEHDLNSDEWGDVEIILEPEGMS